jgi:hypothetical protein
MLEGTPLEVEVRVSLVPVKLAERRSVNDQSTVANQQQKTQEHPRGEMDMVGVDATQIWLVVRGPAKVVLKAYQEVTLVYA